jgi:Dioxygenase
VRRRLVDARLRAPPLTSLAALFVLTIWIRHSGATDSAMSPEARGRRLQALSWDREIASMAEPGRRMVLQGTVRRSAGGKVLPGFVFFVYQADAQGRYGLPGPDSAKARLSGFVKAGPDGQFRIRSILPGTYGGPPHLHFEFRDSLGAMRVSFVNLFPSREGDYTAYGPDYPRSHWKSTPGLKSHWITGPIGRLLITQPADLDVHPDSSGVFRVKWDLDVSLSAPHPEHPGWGPEAPR